MCSSVRVGGGPTVMSAPPPENLQHPVSLVPSFRSSSTSGTGAANCAAPGREPTPSSSPRKRCECGHRPRSPPSPAITALSAGARAIRASAAAASPAAVGLIPRGRRSMTGVPSSCSMAAIWCDKGCDMCSTAAAFVATLLHDGDQALQRPDRNHSAILSLPTHLYQSANDPAGPNKAVTKRSSQWICLVGEARGGLRERLTCPPGPVPRGPGEIGITSSTSSPRNGSHAGLPRRGSVVGISVRCSVPSFRPAGVQARLPEALSECCGRQGWCHHQGRDCHARRSNQPADRSRTRRREDARPDR